MSDATPPPAPPPTTSRPVPQAPDEQGNYEGYHVGFWRQPWVQQVVPWATSLGVHVGLVALAIALLASGALSVLIPERVQQQVTVPTATLATENIGGVPSVGNLEDVTSQNKSLNPVADSTDERSRGEGESAADLLTPTSGGSTSSDIGGITGMGALSDALGGGGGEGATLFGEAGGASGFMGIDIGKPGDGGAAYRIVYVCDASGSMDGEKKLLLFRELARSIEDLDVDQSFNVVFLRGDDYLAAFGDGLKPATGRFKGQAVEFLDTVAMQGTTNPVPALRAALGMDPDLVFFLTDGEFNGVVGYEEVVETVERLNTADAGGGAAAAINTIQFVTSDDTAAQVLEQIAGDNGGIYVYRAREDL